MIVVIQCAGSKRKNAGFLKTKDGRTVSFVARPELAPPASCVYARPDDASDAGGTWRDQLLAYNASPGNNPLRLLPAFELYENDIYRALVKRFGVENTYILSAGWGLIDASFFDARVRHHIQRAGRQVCAPSKAGCFLRPLSDACQHDRAGRVFRQQGVRDAFRRPHARCNR